MSRAERASDLRGREYFSERIGALPDRWALSKSGSTRLECGYSSASWSGRIYSGPERSGILLYTAVPAAEGTQCRCLRASGDLIRLN